MPTPPGPIVFLGDSLTAADGLPPQQRFLGRLAARFPDRRFDNQGRNGWSTGAYLRRWDEVAPTLPEDAGLVVVMLGSNDLREYGHDDDTLDGLITRMTELLQRVADRAPRADRAIAAPPQMEIDQLTAPIREVGFGDRTNPLLRAMADRYRDLAGGLGLGFVDLSACLDRPAEPTDAPPLTTDGAHPNAEGYQRLADPLGDWLGERLS